MTRPVISQFVVAMTIILMLCACGRQVIRPETPNKRFATSQEFIQTILDIFVVSRGNKDVADFNVANLPDDVMRLADGNVIVKRYGYAPFAISYDIDGKKCIEAAQISGFALSRGFTRLNNLKENSGRSMAEALIARRINFEMNDQFEKSKRFSIIAEEENTCIRQMIFQGGGWPE